MKKNPLSSGILVFCLLCTSTLLGQVQQVQNETQTSTPYTPRYAEEVDIEKVRLEKIETERTNRSTTFVVTKVEDTNDFVCDADCSLREAVYASSNTAGNDIITFSSLFDTPQTIILTLGQIEFGGPGGIGGNHIVNGPGEDLLTIDAQNNSRIFYLGFAHMTLELTDMSLINANSASSNPYGNYGGAILNLGVAGSGQKDMTLRNVTIRNSRTAFGGGMSGLRSHWLLENVTFDGNYGNSWGSAFESEGGNVIMNNCAVINSTGSDAIKPFASSFVQLDAFLTANNTTFSGNNSFRPASVILATGASNTAHVNLNSCTITNNTSTNAAIVYSGNAIIESHNSIISGNQNNNGFSDINGGNLVSGSSYNLIGVGGGLTNNVDNNIVGIDDPVLDALTNNGGTTSYHHVPSNSSSPAYNAGDSSSLTTDQLGNPRGVYGADDIGAIEVQQIDLEVNAIAYLEGPSSDPFVNEESLMRDNLRTGSLIPTTSPYTDNLTCDASVFIPTGVDAIVDWVWVELRNPVDNTIVISSRSALLQRDGDIVDVDGVSAVTFTDTPPDNYYVVVNHRNHLGIISAATFALTDLNSTSIDLASSSGSVGGGTAGVVLLGNGKYAMYGGDYDENGQILNTDIQSAILVTGTAGYDHADCDMNGQILNTDIQLIMTPNAGKGQQF